MSRIFQRALSQRPCIIEAYNKEENRTRTKKSLDNRSNPGFDGLCDEACLELGNYPVPQLPVVNCLQNIGSKIITY